MQHSRYQWFRLAWLGLFPLVTSACGAPKPTAAPAPQASFAWVKPDSCALPGATPVTFAVISPRTIKAEGSGSSIDNASVRNAELAAWTKPKRDLLESFNSSMRQDLFALLTCKGFTTRGPFASYDEMVFPDRTGSDLILQPEIDLTLSVRGVPVTQSFGNALFSAALGAKSPTSTKVKGKATIGGKITLGLRESITDTRMWTRTVAVPSESFEFVSDREYPVSAEPYFAEVLTGDAAFIRELAPRLLTVYQNVMTAAWRYSDPQEMQMVKGQSLEPRKRGVAGIAKE